MEISWSLIDLGMSIDLLPFSVYLQLGLGELHPTQVTIQLAGQSMKVPKGKITDVLIQVRDFSSQLTLLYWKPYPRQTLEFRLLSF